MIWLREDIGMAVQIVGSYPSATEKTRTVDIEGARVNVIGMEDLMIDRLVAAKFWRSNPKLDVEEATVLGIQFGNSLDLEYLKRRAAKERVSDYFDSFLA